MKITIKRAIACVAVIPAIVLAYGCGESHFIYPDPDIRIENLQSTVNYLTSLHPARSYAHPDSMEKAAHYIFRKLAEYGMEPSEQAFIAGGQHYVNIIASTGPREGSRVIVGAHYDTCGDRPGADDNASAVAGLLEVARFAKQHESELPFRIDFVAYALEEPPFFRTQQMGSYVHAKYLAENGIKVKGMICLEMIGFFTDEHNSQSYPLSMLSLFYPSTGNFIGIVSNFDSASLANKVAKHMKVTSVGTRTLKAPSFVAGVDFSDHRNYWTFGYEAVMVTDTSFFRNPNYHEETDTMNTLDFKRMGEVVKGVCWSILNLR